VSQPPYLQRVVGTFTKPLHSSLFALSEHMLQQSLHFSCMMQTIFSSFLAPPLMVGPLFCRFFPLHTTKATPQRLKLLISNSLANHITCSPALRFPLPNPSITIITSTIIALSFAPTYLHYGAKGVRQSA
jgi:hypothetical protein